MQNKSDSFLCTLLGMGCSNGVAFNSLDTSFGNGTNSNRESAAVDAHYGGAETFDYFKNVHGRNGIFGTGAGAPSRVHYGNKYVNAFWDGTKMTYGDGDGVEFGPLVSLDVAGHEMSHGVTENTAGLTYSGESGGLNESTSDIFGTMVEFYAANANDPGDYFIGEEFDLASGQGFRRMDDPALDGVSHSCWSATTKNVDVHYSSGVGNHFFYLLAEGSGSKQIGGRTHTSPTCNGSTVAGIGSGDAARHLVPRARRLLHLGHHVRAGADGDHERRCGPVRCGQPAAERGGGSVECRQRELSQSRREQRSEGGGAEHDDQERRPQQQEYGGHAERRCAGVEHERLLAGERLDSHESGEQGDRDQVGHPRHEWPLQDSGRHRKAGELEEIAADAGEDDRGPHQAAPA